MTTRWWLWCVVGLSIGGCAKAPLEAGVSGAVAEVAEPAERLASFFDAIWQRELADDPVRQSYLGVEGADNRSWTDTSEAAERARLDAALADLEQLQAEFDPQALSVTDQLSVRLFEHRVRAWEEGWRWRHHGYPVHQMYGTHSWIPNFMSSIHRIDDEADAEAYIARLRGVDGVLQQLFVELEAGEAIGVLPPAFVFPRVLDDCRNILSGAPFDEGPADSAMLADFRGRVEALQLEPARTEQLIVEASAALVEVVQPGYLRLIEILERQAATATTDDGAWKLPDGGEYYAWRLRQATTTELSPAELHQLGLDEVARIHDEMRAIMASVGFEGELEAFFEHLRTEPRFTYPNDDEGREAYLQRATEILRTMEARLPEVFLTTPRAAIEIERVEPWRERSAGKAFYQRGTPDGTRKGTYYANLYDMSDMPIYQMEALAYHEGLPGHHMQGSIAQELSGLPEFRKQGGYTAYGEGWGLYSEYLPKEMGLYADPYSDFGRLAMELWRACRLVVDTGIHDKGWTRQQAIDYLRQNTPNPEGDTIKAIERYIVMPGQATAYKVGMIKILQLRSRAEEQLGEAFDLRAFHELVLTNGPVPLDVLEELVDAWIAGGGGVPGR